MAAARKRALISVSDKTGIIDFARALAALEFELISTGGTARLLAGSGIAVTAVEDYTGFPEMLAGRVKTLHPRIHAGLLGRPGEDDASLAAHDIPRIDLAVINLYPFESVTARQDCTLAEAIEQIDIGGPALVRSAAKNHTAVGVVTRPEQYPLVLQRLREGGGRLDDACRFELAVAAFNRIAQYDAAISNYLSAVADDGSRAIFPRQFNAGFEKIIDLRYGENPHQQAAWYREPGAAGGLDGAQMLQGKELSFNNVADADAAWACVRRFPAPACVIVKHANPCGVALGAGPLEAYRKAWETDPTSAFGGIIAFNRGLDAGTAQAIVGQQFAEVVIAPEFSEGAKQAFAAKPNIRVLLPAPGEPGPQLDLRRVSGGLLLQTGDNAQVTREQCRVVTRRQPTEPEWQDLLFAWQVVRAVKSNAIVMVAGGRTLGIGAGQMSRVDATRIACWKAGEAGLSLSAGRMASDAFFPFRDGVDSAAQAGMAAIIQPGGSLRDGEVIAAADEHGIAMVFTGVRHFRH